MCHLTSRQLTQPQTTKTTISTPPPGTPFVDDVALQLFLAVLYLPAPRTLVHLPGAPHVARQLGKLDHDAAAEQRHDLCIKITLKNTGGLLSSYLEQTKE